jgi:hypothetical protein
MKDRKIRNLATALMMLALLPSITFGQIIWSDDFESGTAGQPPQGWTAYDGGTPNGNWTIVDDDSKALEQSNASAFDTWCVPDDSPNLSTLCLKAKVKIIDMDGEGAVDILARMDNGDIHFGYGDDGAGSSGLYIYDDFAGVMLAILDYPLQLNTWYYFKACLCGGELKLKVWDADSPEPDEYLVEASTAYTSPGSIGVRTSSASARFDDIEVHGSCGAVPTMSQWGLITLVTLMVIVGIVILRRKLRGNTA